MYDQHVVSSPLNNSVDWINCCNTTHSTQGTCKFIIYSSVRLLANFVRNATCYYANTTVFIVLLVGSMLYITRYGTVQLYGTYQFNDH